MQLHFKPLFLCLWQKGHHLEERVSHEILSRGKPLHYFFIQCGAGSSCAEHQRRRRAHYITLGAIRGRHEPTVCIWWHHYDSWSPVHYVLWYNNTVPVHRNVQGMDWNTITSTAAGALNCTIILLQHAAAATHLKRSDGQPSFPSVTPAVRECVGQMSSSISAETVRWLDDCMVTRSEGNTGG